MKKLTKKTTNKSDSKVRVHVVSETAYFGKGQGVHTAFVDCVNLLRRSGKLDVIENQDGWGDVLHAHTYGPYFFWKGRKYKGRRIFTVHVIPESARGSIPAERWLIPFVRRYLCRVYNYANVCISISPAVTESLRKLKVSSRIVEIGNPIDTDRFFRSSDLRLDGRQLFGIPEDAFVVLGVGQLEGRKGVEDFIDIALACPDIHFIWAGGRPLGATTEGKNRIDRRIRDVGSRVHFIGLFDLEKMPLVYNAADAFLFPSHQENCPLAPIEAAACGLPVIYRDLSEYRRLYKNEYLAAADTATFIKIIRRLHSDSSYYAHAVTMSETLIKQFGRDQILESLERLYIELVQQD
jgi:1,2-diacylglycerol-3-alpha-glucose alpha-1,2-galactosyltransferase